MSLGSVALAGGWWIFLIFLIVFFFVLAGSYYTRRGSAINLRTWHERGTSAEGSPPSLSHDQAQNVRNWSRGTAPSARRAARRARRRRPAGRRLVVRRRSATAGPRGVER